MSKTEYKDHPLSSVLPLMGQMEIQELAADIQANGLRVPITLLDGQILDGRNRYRACKFVDVEPRFRDFNGDGDPLSFIVSVNVKRRHLTTGQKSMVAAKIANLPSGMTKEAARSAKLPTSTRTEKEAAEELKVSPRSVRTAKEVLRDAPKKEIEAVERGEKKLGTVAREVKESKVSKSEKTHLDKTGYPIPDSILEDWNRAEAFSSNLRELSRIKGEISSGLEKEDLIFRELNNSAISMLTNLYGELKCVIPYAVCTSCQGQRRKGCTLCKQRGFISHFAYSQFVPAEIKALRQKAAGK